MRSTRGGRFGVGAVLPMVLVAGLAVAALTSHAAGEAHADDAKLELVSIEAGNGKAEACANMSVADRSACLDQAAATKVASTSLDEHEAPMVKKSSCARASKSK